MPHCLIHTTVKDSALRDGVEGRIAHVVAEALSKPIERVCVFINTGERAYRLGSTEPTLHCTIHAVDVFDEQRSPKYCDAIFKVLQEEFGLPKDRCVVLFSPIQVHQVAK